MQNYPGPMMGLAMAAAVLAAAGGARGQENFWFWEIEYSNPAGMIRSLGDTATVTLWAAWDPQYYAFRGARLDVVGDDPEDAGEWADWRVFDHLFVNHVSDHGTLDGEAIRDIVAIQPYWPWEPPRWPDTSNPISVWTATWRTGDLTPRDVIVETLSESFLVYSEDAYWVDFVDVLMEGSVVITVVPAPSLCWIPLAILPAMLRRRR